MQIQSIIIEAEQWIIDQGDPTEANAHVIVELDNGTAWMASFYTYKQVSSIVESYKASGEYLNGKYFWDSNLILIDEISRKCVEEVVKHLIDVGEFTNAFWNCPKNNGLYFWKQKNQR